MNNVALTGRLTKDPDVRSTAGGTSVTRFTLAVDRMKKEDGADFISCVSFGKTAETIGKYVTKGRQIGLIGHIQTGSYEKNGTKVYTTDVIVDRFEFLGSKADSNTNHTHNTVNGSVNGFMSVPDGIDEELPFD